MNQATPVALITGAGSGIGRALALSLAQEGYAIAAIDLREEGLRSLADELQALHRPIAWSVADVTDPAGLFQSTRDLEAQLGPIDLLVANAGILLKTPGLHYSIDDMNQVITVNLIGVSNTIGAVLPGMIERKRGHLVAVSSAASYRGMPRVFGYCASKAGVNAIMDGLRVELAHLGIHATTVCPGWVRTQLSDQVDGQLDYLIEVDEAAQEIAYAIRTKKAFHAFPRKTRWAMRVLLMLPRAWQDWYIRRVLKRFKVPTEEQVVV